MTPVGRPSQAQRPPTPPGPPKPPAAARPASAFQALLAKGPPLGLQSMKMTGLLPQAPGAKRSPKEGAEGQGGADATGLGRVRERESRDARDSQQNAEDDANALTQSLQAAQWGPPPGAELSRTPGLERSAAAVELPAATSPEAAAEAVHRFSFAGDGQTGTARIVLKEGVMAGSPVVVRVDGKAVRISGASDAAGEAWTERICARLRERGYDAEAE